jgi:hypothetical protein
MNEQPRTVRARRHADNATNAPARQCGTLAMKKRLASSGVLSEAPSDDRAHTTTNNIRQPELDEARQQTRGQIATRSPGAQPEKGLRAIDANANSPTKASGYGVSLVGVVWEGQEIS